MLLTSFLMNNLLSEAASGTVYYVGEGGDNANDGTTYANRKATFANVVSTYSLTTPANAAGVTVLLCSGTSGGGSYTWTEQINMVSGTSGSYFTVGVRGGDTITMDGSTAGSSGIFQFDNVDWSGIVPGSGTLILGNVNDWSYTNYDGYSQARNINVINGCTNLRFVGTGTGRWHTTDSNFKVRGARNYFGNYFSYDSSYIYMYGIDWTGPHGTIDTWDYPSTLGQPGRVNDDWGDFCAMYASRMYVVNCCWREGGHNNVETTGKYVHYKHCEFDGYHRAGDLMRAADIPTLHAGMRASDLSPAQQSNGATAPWGPVLMEDCVLRNTQRADQRDQTVLKTDGVGVVFRGNFVFDSIDRIFQNNAYNELGDGSCGYLKFYNNTSFNVAAVGSQRTADSTARAYNNMYPYTTLKNNIFDALTTAVFGRPHYWRQASGEQVNGFPDEWKGGQYDGNVFNRADGTDVELRLTKFDFSEVNFTPSTANALYPNAWGANNLHNQAVTYDGDTNNRYPEEFGVSTGVAYNSAVALVTTSNPVVSSTTIPLQTGESRCFKDAWGMSSMGNSGDYIYLQEIDQIVQITAIDYTTDELTVSTAVTLSDASPIFWAPSNTVAALNRGAAQLAIDVEPPEVPTPVITKLVMVFR